MEQEPIVGDFLTGHTRWDVRAPVSEQPLTFWEESHVDE
jgi:hypothetical protein